MVLLRLGKEREANLGSAIEYNKAVAEYLATMGYSLSQNSFLDGTQVDMIFDPYLKTSRRVWVEAKNAKVGLSDEDFQREMMGYMSSWLLMPPEDRFELRVFVREMSNPRKWDRLFSPKATPEDMIEWVEMAVQVGDFPVVNTALAQDREAIVYFFGTAYAYEGDRRTIHEHAESKGETSAVGVKGMARMESDEMIERYRLGTKAVTYISNLVPMIPPERYCILTIREESSEETKLRLKEVYLPPYVFISNSEILTLQHTKLLKEFECIDTIESKEVTRVEMEKACPDSLIALLNFCISRIVQIKGGEEYRDGKKHVFFFPPKGGKMGKHPSCIPSSTGRDVQVAVPKKNQSGEVSHEFRMSFPKTSVNYCFHQGLVARTVFCWGQYYVSIRDRRVYTTNGYRPIVGERAARLDAYYRAPMYNHADSRLSLLRAFAHYLFNDWSRTTKTPIFVEQFKFGKPLTIGSDASPVVVELGDYDSSSERGGEDAED
jgi:hypothetical protein